MSMNIFNAETGELEQVAGYQPATDKVEIGNMNPVTSNAVANGLDTKIFDSRTQIVTLFNNAEGTYLDSDLNYIATKSGLLRVSFYKRYMGNTLSIFINNIHRFGYPNFFGEYVSESACIPVKKNDKIRITSDINVSQSDKYKIVNVIII